MPATGATGIEEGTNSVAVNLKEPPEDGGVVVVVGVVVEEGVVTEGPKVGFHSFAEGFNCDICFVLFLNNFLVFKDL